ncbi:MAG: DUF3006 domain-containing protein [Eubacterium sp.]
MKLIIDRFEGNYAVCEISAGKTVQIPTQALPKEASEGDVISITVDKSETDKRKEKINGLMNSLFKN